MAPRSPVKHSTTEPLCSLCLNVMDKKIFTILRRLWRVNELHTGYVHRRFYPGTEILILPMSSYPGCHIIVTSSCYVELQRIQDLLDKKGI